VSAAHAATPLTTTRVASGLSRPVFVTAPPGDERLFIVEQRGADNRGRIKILKDGVVLPTPFLTTAVLPAGNEQGLYSLAFAPDYATSGIFYIHYTDNTSTNRVVRHTVSNDPDIANATGTIVYSASQPFSNHNGGWMAFGPDGFLYVALGDGGSANDPGDRALNINSNLGKMLRLDVSGVTATGAAGNPFAGPTPGLDEIFSYGLRNPWRCSFDRLTGDLIIGDVGQGNWEEIDFAPADSARGLGWNWGWRCYEGTHAVNTSATIPCGSCMLTPACAFRWPAYEYSHAGGACSVTGGYVYRGCAIPDLQGTYFFADYCNAIITSGQFVNGTLTNLVNRTAQLDPPGALSIATITSFGEDAFGELYICDQAGEVFKIIPAAAGVAESDMPALQVTTALGTLGATTPGNAITPGITPFTRPGSRIQGVGYLSDAAIRACPETTVSAQALTTFLTHTRLGSWDIDMSASVDSDSATLTRTFTFTNTAMAASPLVFTDVVAPHLNGDDDVAAQFAPAAATASALLGTSEPADPELFVLMRGFADGAAFGFDVDELTALEARVAADQPLTGNMQAGPARTGMAVSFDFGSVGPDSSVVATVVIDLRREGPATDAGGDDVATIRTPSLQAMGPMPFRDVLPLAYALPAAAQAQIAVFDVRGRRVRELLNAATAAGTHQVTWDGADDAGRQLGAGVYFIRLSTASGERSLRVVRMR
jgi:glucose/arabinose dehydrogenase